MKTEKIGQVTFYPSTSSPDDQDNPIDCTFAHMCEEGGLALVIRLDTEDEAQAVERGRRIVQLWQLAVQASDNGAKAIEDLKKLGRPGRVYTMWTAIQYLFGKR